MPNALWLSALTEFAIWQSFASVSFIIDAFTPRRCNCAMLAPTVRQSLPAARAHSRHYETRLPLLLARKHTTRKSMPVCLRSAYGYANRQLTTLQASSRVCHIDTLTLSPTAF